MSDEAPAGFEEPLLETRQGPVLDGHGENEPAQEIAEVVGDHPEEQPHLIGPEPVTGEAGAHGGGGCPPFSPLRRPRVGVVAGGGSGGSPRGGGGGASGGESHRGGGDARGRAAAAGRTRRGGRT